MPSVSFCKQQKKKKNFEPNTPLNQIALFLSQSVFLVYTSTVAHLSPDTAVVESHDLEKNLSKRH